MKQKKERPLKNSVNRAQDGEGMQDINEHDLEQVAGGMKLTPEMEKERGPLVASGTSLGGMPWARYANGETILGRSF